VRTLPTFSETRVNHSRSPYNPATITGAVLPRAKSLEAAGDDAGPMPTAVLPVPNLIANPLFNDSFILARRSKDAMNRQDSRLDTANVVYHRIVWIFDNGNIR